MNSRALTLSVPFEGRPKLGNIATTNARSLQKNSNAWSGVGKGGGGCVGDEKCLSTEI